LCQTHISYFKRSDNSFATRKKIACWWGSKAKPSLPNGFNSRQLGKACTSTEDKGYTYRGGMHIMLASIFHVEPLMITELWLHPSYHKAHFLHAPLHMWSRYSKHTHILLVLSVSLTCPNPNPNLQCPTAIWNKSQYVGTRYKLQTLELEFLSMDRLKRGFDRHNLVALMLSREGRKGSYKSELQKL
jgi:hypothetical protein